MFYQIYDAGAGILIGSTPSVLLLKHHITSISVIGNNLVRIAGAHHLRSILLDYREVLEPICGSAQELANRLNTMVTSCVCGSSGNGGG